MSRCNNCKEVHKETTETTCIRHNYTTVTPIDWKIDRFGRCEASFRWVPCYACWQESFDRAFPEKGKGRTLSDSAL